MPPNTMVAAKAIRRLSEFEIGIGRFLDIWNRKFCADPPLSLYNRCLS